MRICVLIPCYNEQTTIASVISDFRAQLPHAHIVVIDNNSTDATAHIAAQEGAHVIRAPLQGKGAAVRHALRRIDSELYILVDGDATYPADHVHRLLDALNQGYEMAVADRRSLGHYNSQNTRAFHAFGNSLVCTLISRLFATPVRDAMSGYRAFTRRFAKSLPILLNGFELETAMTLHAIDRNLPFIEIPIPYRNRPQGSQSKLRTLSDGLLVLRTILWIFKDTKPLIVFTMLSLIQAFCAAMLLTAQPLTLSASLVTAIALGLSALITLCSGFILDTLVRYHRELCEIQILTHTPPPKP